MESNIKKKKPFQQIDAVESLNSQFLFVIPAQSTSKNLA